MLAYAPGRRAGGTAGGEDALGVAEATGGAGASMVAVEATGDVAAGAEGTFGAGAPTSQAPRASPADTTSQPRTCEV